MQQLHHLHVLHLLDLLIEQAEVVTNFGLGQFSRTGHFHALWILSGLSHSVPLGIIEASEPVFRVHIGEALKDLLWDLLT